MRTLLHFCAAATLLLANPLLFAQAPAAEPTFLIVTTMHTNLKVDDFSMDEWIATEKEYFDKIVSKNEHIVSSNVLTHYFTADNTEILFATKYKDWNGIELAQKRSTELAAAAWPDEKARTAYFDKRSSYYQTKHSDEIYAVIPGGKDLAAMPDKPMVYYVRKSEMAYPKDGTEKEIDMLTNQYIDAVTKKEPLIKAYYQYVHAWGSNRNDYIEVTVFENLGDIEKSFAAQEKLFSENWKDEATRKQYDDKVGRYYTGAHADYIYRSVPGLAKPLSRK